MQFVSMSLEDIAQQCIDDSTEWFPNTVNDLGFLTIAMLGEAGEFANWIKKGMRGDYNIDDEDYHRELAVELTDVFIYLMNIAGVLGIDMEKMYQIKREFNNERFRKATEDDGDLQL